ncbi:MAG: UDP-N-acetylglucosamine 1-carboxyvinyltransferase, partial [Cyanobacteria bacterium P01_F01_bin.116]
MNLEDITITTSFQADKRASSESAPVIEIWGQQSLNGHISVSGAKNSALVVMAGTILCSQDCRIRNIPNLVDIGRMADVLKALGVKVAHNGNTLDVDARSISHSRAPYEIVSKLRASF